MAKKKSPAKASQPENFEARLWDTANSLRGSVESSEYKHVVLSLIFLKFANDKFQHQRAKIIAEHGKQIADLPVAYTKNNVFYLEEESRWDYLIANAKQDGLALRIDTALAGIEKSNQELSGALPDNYFSRLGLEPAKLASLLDAINQIDTITDNEEDVVGRVYEYFLGKFAAAEGKGGGEFYTPKCVVKLLVEMLEPFKGRVYDPCCGSGGMFVQSVDFIKSHAGNTSQVNVIGQELTNTTYKLAKMNLAIRGILPNLGDAPANTFHNDQHKDLTADFIIANPPFNLKAWRANTELLDDPRWDGYDIPPAGNANYAWILHMISKLSLAGTAGFVLANGSMSTSTNSEGKIRQQIIENDLVDCMIALPGQLFYTTQIPVCLWFLSKDKAATHNRTHRKRTGETLFIDARKLGSLVDRTHRELSTDEIAKIAQTYHAWRGETADADGKKLPKYQDTPGFCKSATLEEIASHDYVLTPGRYVGAEAAQDDGIPFETKMSALSSELYQQFAQAKKLQATITKNLKALGYDK